MTSDRLPLVWFIVESGTDARLVEGLAARVRLNVLARDIPGGRPVSQPTTVPVTIAGPERAAFSWSVFRALLRAGSRDVVLVQGYGLAALAANVASRLRGCSCWMLVCSPVAEYYAARRAAGASFSSATHAAIRWLAALNGLVGQGYIVLSGYLGDVVRASAPRRPIHVIPVYGVDTRRFRRRVDQAAARADRGLPPTGEIVFSSSRVAPEKDTTTLLEAFAALVQEGRDIHLLHRSGGYRELVEHADRFGVRGRVIATDAADPREDLALDYVASDVCVQASRAEGLGFSVLEALACGTPVVATAVGGLVETVRDGITGWSVPPHDSAALAAALRDVLDHPDRARRLAAAGAAMVREHFDAVMVFDRLVTVIAGD
jgi:glycosyltransferase involved in cell wall biosynthesis